MTTIISLLLAMMGLIAGWMDCVRSDRSLPLFKRITPGGWLVFVTLILLTGITGHLSKSSQNRMNELKLKQQELLNWEQRAGHALQALFGRAFPGLDDLRTVFEHKSYSGNPAKVRKARDATIDLYAKQMRGLIEAIVKHINSPPFWDGSEEKGGEILYEYNKSLELFTIQSKGVGSTEKLKLPLKIFEQNLRYVERLCLDNLNSVRLAGNIAFQRSMKVALGR